MARVSHAPIDNVTLTTSLAWVSLAEERHTALSVDCN